MLSIKVKDKTYSFCWGTLTFMNTCDKLGISLDELDLAILSNDIKTWHTLSYQALLTGDLVNNNGVNTIEGELEGFNFAQYVFWLDQQPQKTGDNIGKSYQDSKYLGKTMKERYDELFDRLNIQYDSQEKTEDKKPIKKKNVRLAK